MADDVNSQLESALKTLLNTTEKSGDPWKELKQHIVDSVSILRNIFVNQKNSGEEQTIKINQLEGELSKEEAELRESRVMNNVAQYKKNWNL